WPSAFSLTRAMKSRTTGSATSASSSAMRTSRSMSCTLSSVMRAWPRICLTSRESLSESAEAIGSGGCATGAGRGCGEGPGNRRDGAEIPARVQRCPKLLAMILSSASPASLVLAVAAAAAYAVPAAAAARLSEQAARKALLAAWVLHGAALAIGLLGDAPRFGFAPAVSVTAWLVLTVYAVEKQVFPQLQARWALAALGAAAVVLA